jgi:hypothetical protein|tara:strand:+ start:74 stop:442 length:369 start_codon:yes stop_codon:yes gene_type:complete
MKLKKLLNENLWNERKFGEPLPTLEDTTKAYKLKQENLNENDLNDVSKQLGKSSSDVTKFLKKYKLEPLDLIDVIDHFEYMHTGQERKLGYEMILKSMKGNRNALRDLKDLLKHWYNKSIRI